MEIIIANLEHNHYYYIGGYYTVFYTNSTKKESLSYLEYIPTSNPATCGGVGEADPRCGLSFVVNIGNGKWHWMRREASNYLSIDDRLQNEEIPNEDALFGIFYFPPYLGGTNSVRIMDTANLQMIFLTMYDSIYYPRSLRITITRYNTVEYGIDGARGNDGLQATVWDELDNNRSEIYLYQEKQGGNFKMWSKNDNNHYYWAIKDVGKLKWKKGDSASIGDEFILNDGYCSSDCISDYNFLNNC